MKYIETSIGKNLTKIAHPQYETLVKSFKKFYHCGQHETPHFVFHKHSSLTDSPDCGPGESVYGVSETEIVKLISIVDTSD